MSGIELLSFACSIMQVISFSRETIGLCTAIYHGRHPDGELTEIATQLNIASGEIQAHFPASQPPDPHQKELCTVATKCAIAARALDEEVQFLMKHHKEGSLKSVMRVAVKTTWRKRRLERLEKSVREYQMVMETRLITRVCTRVNALEVKQDEAFLKLGKDVQFLITQYASGHDKLCDLITTEIRQVNVLSSQNEQLTRTHVTAEVSEARQSITSHLDSQFIETVDKITRNTRGLSLQTQDSNRRSRLLQSLKYPGMNERFNQISDSHEGTFKWIFPQNDHQSDHSNDEFNSSDDLWSDDDCPEVETLPWDGTNHSYDYGSANEKAPLWDDFIEWLKSDGNLYWISGKPGSGKSTLVKSILSNSFTGTALQAWRQDTIIISHFFWKPGALMQRSIKGLFCSLLYQMLQYRQDVLKNTLAEFEFLQDKDADTDWSVKELRSLTFNILQGYPIPVCIFIDGLDEICDEDGAIQLLGLVEALSAISNVKICVASRPEQRFQDRLKRNPQLKLHDLTARDMLQYANQLLESYTHAHQSSRHVITKLKETLVAKAQGVFLWLQLAIKSLMDGIEDGDNAEDLEHRLKSLPDEISHMYSDMWSRQNGNSRLHRQVTATYINLMIGSITIEVMQERWTTGSVPLIVVMVATEPELQGMPPEEISKLDNCVLERLISNTVRLIKIRCNGLVELIPSQAPFLRARRDGIHKSLLRHLQWNLAFIHRTAYEFFMDTEEGQFIRAYDRSISADILARLLRGHLAQVTIFSETSENVVYAFLKPLMCIVDMLPRRQIQDLFYSCWRAYNCSYLKMDDWYHEEAPCHFLAVAALPCLEELILSIVEKSTNPSALATEILRDMVGKNNIYIGIPDFSRVVESFLVPLISLGGSPNIQGLSFREYPLFNKSTNGRYIRTCTASSRFLETALRERAKSHIIDDEFNEKIYNDYNAEVRSESIGSYMGCFSILAKMSLDLNERIPLAINVSANWSFGLSTLARCDLFPGQHQEFNSKASCVDHIILEINPTFLLYALRSPNPGIAEAGIFDIEEIKNMEASYRSLCCLRYIGVYRAARMITRYRPRNQEIVQPFMRLLASWLCGESFGLEKTVVESAAELLKNIVHKAEDYEVVGGHVRACLAEEGWGYSEITREQISERQRRMREEASQCPGY